MHPDPVAVEEGFLLGMSPERQADCKHAILPAEADCGGRIRLTFRRMRGDVRGVPSAWTAE